jgi:glycosyltransferase involved in cell wall biosynthesis
MMGPSRLPKVSVIIPTFNRAQLLGEAIESVLTQKVSDVELLVIDDGSTDDTAAGLEAYGDRLTVLRQPNRGVSSARNLGIDNARADLIAFLDSDDIWLPGKLSRQLAFFRNSLDALICQTEEVWIRKGVRVNPKNRHRKPSGDIFTPSLELCLVSPSAVMMHRQLFEAVGRFDEALPACEDYDLWLRIASRYPVYLIDTPLIVKRGGHADQLSRMKGLDRYRIASLRNLLESGTLSGEQQLAAARMLRRKCNIYAAGCEKRGRNAEARAYRDLAARYADTGKPA